MIQPEKLKELGEKIAEDFLQREVPLNVSLEKVAEAYALNSHQLHRVAETANVKTHLHMLKEAATSDAYIVFDLADAQSVKPVEKSANSTLDYEEAPDINFFQYSKTASKESEPAKNLDTDFKNKTASYIESSQKAADLQRAHNSVLEAS